MQSPKKDIPPRIKFGLYPTSNYHLVKKDSLLKLWKLHGVANNVYPYPNAYVAEFLKTPNTEFLFKIKSSSPEFRNYYLLKPNLGLDEMYWNLARLTLIEHDF